MSKKKYKKREDSIVLAKNILENLDKIRDIEKNPELFRQFADLLQLSGETGAEYVIPDYIFVKKLTLLESIVKYLKENLGLSYKKIAELLGRDQRNLWQIYHSAKQKRPSKFTFKKSRFTIHVSVLSGKKFSVLESIVAYLKDKLGLTYNEIAKVVKRDYRTVWTVYDRVKNKKNG